MCKDGLNYPRIIFWWTDSHIVVPCGKEGNNVMSPSKTST